MSRKKAIIIGAGISGLSAGWLDRKGKTHEKVYDVVWSGDRKPDRKGKLPPVGNTVDAKTASFTNTIGSSELGMVWTDPDFDPMQKAFYYARVILFSFQHFFLLCIFFRILGKFDSVSSVHSVFTEKFLNGHT